MLLDKLLSGPYSRGQGGIAGRPVRQMPIRSTFAAENRTADEMLKAGTDTVVYLLEHRYIDQDTADEVLRRMLAGYVSYIVGQQMESAIIDAVALSVPKFERSNNG